MAERDDDDATRLSDDHVLDRFRAATASNPAIGIEGFFLENPSIDRARYLVPVILTDIKRRETLGKPRSPRAYFNAFSELASHDDAWKILEATSSWLVENEGPDWADDWVKAYPLFAPSLTRSPATDDADAGVPRKIDALNIDDLKPNDCLLDFQIVRFIGKGTFGRVYLANDLSLDRQCALKVTVDQGSEGQVLARLSHPGIVHVYREQSLCGKKVLAMQFVEGQSLADWIGNVMEQKRTNRTENHLCEAVRLVRDVAISLKHAHGRGVLHRDIKPANILLDQDQQPLLSDFNVATAADQCGRFTVGGTINYMSPEQLQAVCLNDTSAEQAVDTRSDVYSLGVVLLECISGEKVWSVQDADNQDAAENQLLASRIRSGPPSIIGLDGVTPSLAAIVDKALQPNADRRYQSAAELETDLTAWLGNRDNLYAENPSFLERTTRRVQRNQGWWAGGAIASSLLVVIAGWGYVSDRQQLDRCVEYADQAKTLIADRQLARASELLGQAKAQSRQIMLARWIHPHRSAAVTTSLERSSRRVSELEASRFTSVFGEISLRRVHQNQTKDVDALIENSLRAYKVMTIRDWQGQSPFNDLPADQKEQVAEGITELMLVSMQQSAVHSRPSLEKVREVLKRLPRQHRSFVLFQSIAKTQEVSSEPFDATRSLDPFEAYLYGVLAMMEQDYESARLWYAHALENLRINHPEPFWWHYQQGFTCQELQRYDEAFIHYGVCLGLQPDFAWPKFNMGLACLDAGKPELAENYFQQAIQVDPEFTAAYVALIAVESQLGKDAEALATYDRAIAQGLESPELTNNRDVAKAKLSTRPADLSDGQ